MNREGEQAGAVLTGPAAPASGMTQFLETLQAGGPVVALLLAMSVAALAIVLAKLWQFRDLRSGETPRAHRALTLWQSGRKGEALTLLQSARGPLAGIVAAAMQGLRRDLPAGEVREEAMRRGGDVLEAFRSWLRPLEVIASLAPLLGLFGTVLGMIEAFRQLETAGNQVDPSILSGGIWEALLTTAVGLAVAIPAVVALNWLERRVERLAHELDSAITRLFTRELSPVSEQEARHAGEGYRPAVAHGGD
ncbi:MotA/TolQ/ExbB proton channel family protein [Minwuia thermotolerans]|nr:MotA/TolQ/ExbB proton channel family protein [Minwuia thermotolerans]